MEFTKKVKKEVKYKDVDFFQKSRSFKSLANLSKKYICSIMTLKVPNKTIHSIMKYE